MTPDAPVTSRRDEAAEILAEGLLALLATRRSRANTVPQHADSNQRMSLLHTPENALLCRDGRGPGGPSPRTQPAGRTR